MKKLNIKEYQCPQCGFNVLTKSTNKETGGSVIKSKLVFLTEEGDILCRCKKCKNIIGLPINSENIKK